MISVQIIDYSSSKLSESEGKINHDALNCADDYNDEPLLSGTVPDWASSRWTNYDVNIDHPGQLKILEHVLRGSLGQHAGELAMESISASGQRARMQFFDGVFFLLSKIPSLPEQFSSKDPATIFRLHDELLNPTAERELDEIIEFELIVFIVEPATGSQTTIQVGKEGDVWNDLRGSLRSNDGGHHDVRNRSTGLLLWNLLNEALRECDHIDESFEAIIEPMLSYFETGDEHVAADDHRMATALKSEMQAFSQQVMPLRDVFTTMATSSFFQKDVMYMEDLRDKSFRIIHNISDHSDNCQRLQVSEESAREFLGLEMALTTATQDLCCGVANPQLRFLAGGASIVRRSARREGPVLHLRYPRRLLAPQLRGGILRHELRGRVPAGP